MTETIADLLPAKVRAWVYALLTAANAGVVVYEAANDLPTWALVTVAIVNGAGFTLAARNTPSSGSWS